MTPDGQGDPLTSLVVPGHSLRPSDPVSEAHEAFSADPTLYAIAIVDDDGLPVGLINRFKFLERMSQPFGRVPLTDRVVSAVMNTAPLIVDARMSLEQVSALFIDDETKYIFDGFIVTRDSRYIGIGTGFSLMRQIMETRQKALYLAYHDALTDLPNRHLFDDRLQQALARARRNQRRIGVLYLDIDRFKVVNDTFGHAVGDLLLQQVAGRFRSIIREEDTLARLSGDEFAIVLAELGRAEDAKLVADKLLQLSREPFVLNGHAVSVSWSVGVATFPDQADEQTALLSMADDALYVAKRTGNTFLQQSDVMTHTPAPGSHLFNTVRHAIDLQQLDVHYQPQLDLRSGLLCGIEALLRWRDPEAGILPTLNLIRAAEDTGLVSEITDYVCGVAFRQFDVWRQAALVEGIRLAINVSGADVRERLVRILKRHLREAELSMADLDLEVTESMLMRSDATAMSVLSELRQGGAHVSVDDFGTGYSSLSRLEQLPVDALKMDKTFVHSIDHGQGQGALARAIVVMAHSLQLIVTAEGVETRKQQAFLKEQDCDRLQGYLLCEPLPGSGMTAYLANERFTTKTRSRPVGFPLKH